MSDDVCRNPLCDEPACERKRERLLARVERQAFAHGEPPLEDSVDLQ